jgi:hypothetical protein
MTFLIPGAGAVPATEQIAAQSPPGKPGPEPSGVYDLRGDGESAADAVTADSAAANLARGGVNVSGIYLTECPQAGLRGDRPRPLNARELDLVEALSNRGNDIRVNQDTSCFPQNETSVDVNPRTTRNIVVGANDYRLGTGLSGFYATTDGGRSWYDGIIPFPSAPAGLSRGEGFVPSGGDPVIVFDRDGIVYFLQIGFYRGVDTGGVFVARSSNGGFTWSRACVPAGTSDANAVCGGTGDVRPPGDGVVAFTSDNDAARNRSVPFDDKPWMTSGPRPSGVQPTCFAPISRTPTACNQSVVGADRLYVTFTRFTTNTANIYLSYSDDQAHSWSPPKVISGKAAFCVGGAAANACDLNQFSVPTVSPTTGHLYVSFQNFNTPDENQFLTVRSKDGGATFEGSFFVTPVYDVNFPRSGSSFTRPDCEPRDQQNGRIVYTNNCFRSNAAGNIAVDKRGGAYADDLYLVLSDNRNGTVGSSNADVFLFKSNDGGSTWIGPTRVNDDTSSLGSISRECGRPAGTVGQLPIPPECIGNFGADQWWPWVDIGARGELNITFHDRRLDTNSTAHEWPTSRQRPGNYLVWQWAAQCQVRQADSRECLSAEARPIPQPTGPIDPGPDPVPGQGAGFVGPFRNFQVSDVPSNFDYSFRAGIFAGDYENIAVEDGKAYVVWTDARNGRSSRNQPGRNPICEQSDVFLDIFSATNGGSGGFAGDLTPFLVAECPSAR